MIPSSIDIKKILLYVNALELTVQKSIQACYQAVELASVDKVPDKAVDIIQNGQYLLEKAPYISNDELLIYIDKIDK